MRKLISVAVVGVMVMSMVACGAKAPSEVVEPTTEVETDLVIGGDPSTWGPNTDETNAVEIPSPIKEYDTVNEAIDAAGFDIVVPEDIDGYSDKNISVYDNNMIQIMYYNDADEIDIRKKAVDSEQPDISGVFVDYTSNESAEADGITYSLKGNDGKVFVVTWDNEGYSYSVYVASGLESDAVLEIAKLVK